MELLGKTILLLLSSLIIILIIISNQNNNIQLLLDYVDKLPLKTINIWVAIIARSFGVLFGIIGIFFGYYYFNQKIRFDRSSAKNKRKRARLETLLNELKHYDSLVDKILRLELKIKADIDQVRLKIDRSFDIVNVYLEQNDVLFGFHENDLLRIIRVNSFVEKNPYIMEKDINTLKKQKTYLYSIRYEYREIFHDAITVCLKYME